MKNASELEVVSCNMHSCKTSGEGYKSHHNSGIKPSGLVFMYYCKAHKAELAAHAYNTTLTSCRLLVVM